MGPANRRRTAAETAVIERLRKVTADLPGVTEGRDGFGHTVWKVGTKSLAILGAGDGVPHLALKSDPTNQALLIKRGGWTRTPYIGQHGWVSATGEAAELDWDEIADLVRDAHENAAPKKKKATGKKKPD
jgi:predicted DNA-binding protein (MmcQ/YjbR family)